MKEAFLGTLREQLRQQAVREVAEGKLRSPVDLTEMCGRIIPVLRKNPLTGVMLKLVKVTDDDLKAILRGAVTDIGMEVKSDGP